MAGAQDVRQFWVCAAKLPPTPPSDRHFSDLGLLKRDKALQLRYNDWSKEIKKKWGTLGSSCPHLRSSAHPHAQVIRSQENYLLKYRLRWGQPDRLSVLKPYGGSIDEISILDDLDSLPIPTVDYFRVDSPPHLFSIIVNDWPYSGTSGLFRP
jgi:hypothetical protein